MRRYICPIKSKKLFQVYNKVACHELLARYLTVTSGKYSTFGKSSSGKSNERSKRKGTRLVPSAYKPTDVEVERFQWWQEKGHFLPNDTSEQFTIMLPPPNVTGVLHLGHALTTTVQDVYARWHRMQGHSVLWIPGLDHAGIATQVVVEKNLWQEKALTRHDVGRDRFLQEIWKWKNEKGGHITEQLKSLGASMDWTRETFTMNPKQSIAVTEAFIQLFNSGLIYRSLSLVNWSCTLQSAISDIEVDHKEVNGATLLTIPGYSKPIEFGVLHDFAYQLYDQDGEIVVSTTRIETMLGDVAVAVHPKDIKYQHLHGSFVVHPFTGKKLPIIADSFVDPNFGTGAVKITPAHDQTDFEFGKRHNLSPITVFNEEGRVITKIGNFCTLRRFHARKAVLAELDKLGLLRGKRDHAMKVPVCSRSGDVIEMLLKPQWFVRCKEMAREAMEAVSNKDLVIEPPEFEKTWFNWLSNIRDWCVSRQLWWGHRVPMYECSLPGESNNVWIAARSESEARDLAAKKLGLSGQAALNLQVRQDQDVLDTWFSAGLLPISVFEWPTQTGSLEKYYPISMMVTGHDILFFWVARMVMLCTELTGQLPFKKVLLHGIVCDAHGKKMSKSLGNVVYPETVIKGFSLEELHKQAQNSFDHGILSKLDFEKTLQKQTKSFPRGIPECGTDALRFTLCSHNIKNHFINFDVNECYTNRLFCNKMWQASKYVEIALKSHPNTDWKLSPNDEGFSKLDRWILSRLAHMVTQVSKGLETGDLHVMAAALKMFGYYEFCDIYLESSKPVLRSMDAIAAKRASGTLLACLDVFLRALSPLMPFLCEELYQKLPNNTQDSIMLAPYPLVDEWKGWRDQILEEEVKVVMEVISSIRRLKKEYLSTSSKNKPTITVVSGKMPSLQNYTHVIKSLAGCSKVTITDVTPLELKGNLRTGTVIEYNCTIHLNTGKASSHADHEKLMAKRQKLINELERLMKITSADGYKAKASEDVKRSHEAKILALQEELKRLSDL